MSQHRTPGTRFPVSATIRDPLHDRIPLSEPELAVISHERFLRLERIQQLGFVSRIWPGARHTRFEHSLGVFHLARRAVEQLRLQPTANWIDDEDARTVSAAALLHDIGHYPFSHAIEELGPPVLSHERNGRDIILESDLAGVLRMKWNIDPERVAALIAPGNASLPAADKLLRGILSGPLDVDKLDYLPRDAQACGVPYGGVDTERLLDSLRISTGIEGATHRIVVDAKGVSPLHSLINARQEMFDNVYWHHTNRALMAMLLRAVQDSLIENRLTPTDLAGFDDWTMLDRLSQPDMPATTRSLILRIRQRQIHKRVLEVSAKSAKLYESLSRLFYDPAARRRIENAIAVRVSREELDRGDAPGVLIDIPKPEKWSTDVWVQFDDPPLGFRRLMPWNEVVGRTDEDFIRFEERRRLIRLVATERFLQYSRDAWIQALQNELASNL